MEEDIKILEEFIEEYNASYPEEKEWVVIYPNQVKEIENLIQRFYVIKSEYKREEYRNELLEKEIREYRNNFIPKSKVKERYEELNHYDYIEIKELLKLIED